MLERADLEEEKIIACLRDDYGLLIKEVAFLPLGADRDTAVYHLIAADENPYFLKLRKGVFNETSVALPQFLSSLGITQIIPPLTTKSGRIWGNLDTFKTILYPYIGLCCKKFQQFLCRQGQANRVILPYAAIPNSPAMN